MKIPRRAARQHPRDKGHVAIIMCTYNGERYLQEQLNSIADQTHPDWSLHVSDDGSADATAEIIRGFADRLRETHQVTLLDGPRLGSALNFLATIQKVPAADFYAFSDQDDIWLPDKLARAISVLAGIAADRPALYCGRTKVVDAHGNAVGFSPAFRRPPSFANALVQSLAGGNTMVVNRSAGDLLRAAGPDPDVVSHDWWAYQLVTGAGGRVFYDPEPAILYRQHPENQVGENRSVGSQITRARLLVKGRLKGWVDRNTRALERGRHLLTADNQRLLGVFLEMKQSRLPRRIMMFCKLGLYRQTRLGTIGLIFATLIGKL